jgi:hypothetical protein
VAPPWADAGVCANRASGTRTSPSTQRRRRDSSTTSSLSWRRRGCSRSASAGTTRRSWSTAAWCFGFRAGASPSTASSPRSSGCASSRPRCRCRCRCRSIAAVRRAGTRIRSPAIHCCPARPRAPRGCPIAPAPLGRTLRALHSLTPPADAPGDALGRADLASRVGKLRERLARIARLERLGAARARALRDTLSDLADTRAWSGGPRWVHGDLYERHLLVDRRGALCGVIDWGDLHAGDPAMDLMIAWTFLPPPARPAFRDAYGPIDGASWRRARFRALQFAIALIEYGRAAGDTALLEVGRRALRNSGT